MLRRIVCVSCSHCIGERWVAPIDDLADSTAIEKSALVLGFISACLLHGPPEHCIVRALHDSSTNGKSRSAEAVGVHGFGDDWL